MAQGAELDLVDIRFYTNASDVYFVEDNEPLEDLNNNLLIVDDKAILAKDTALQAQTDFTAHQGGGGSGAHGPATPTVAGFMTSADKLKMDGIQAGASVNTISPTDSLELVSTGETVLHRHPNVDVTRKGFMEGADKTKLDGIQTGANVNNVPDIDASTLTTGPLSNATLLHTHAQPSFVETFTEAIHFTHDHTGLPGITPFTGLSSSSFTKSTLISSSGAFTQFIFTQPFAFTISTLNGGMRLVASTAGFTQNRLFRIDNVAVVGNTGFITFSIEETVPQGAGLQMDVWMGATGL